MSDKNDIDIIQNHQNSSRAYTKYINYQEHSQNAAIFFWILRAIFLEMFPSHPPDTRPLLVAPLCGRHQPRHRGPAVKVFIRSGQGGQTLRGHGKMDGKYVLLLMCFFGWFSWTSQVWKTLTTLLFGSSPQTSRWNAPVRVVLDPPKKLPVGASMAKTAHFCLRLT